MRHQAATELQLFAERSVMRARNIKPGLFANEVLGTGDPLLTLLFAALWLLADRSGRLEDRPLRIKAQAFPYRDGIACDEMLTWLAQHGFITRYVVGGAAYIQIVKFSEHQHPHIKEAASRIPPPQHQTSTVLAPEAHRTSPSDSLIPNILIPNSLNPAAPCKHSAASSRLKRNPPSETDSERQSQIARLKDAYPSNTHPEAHWLIGEREACHRVDEGEPWEVLLAGVERFKAQCVAHQILGTHKVTSPKNFFTRPACLYREKFPISPGRSQIRQDANIDASLTWLQRQESKDATG